MIHHSSMRLYIARLKNRDMSSFVTLGLQTMFAREMELSEVSFFNVTSAIKCNKW